MNLVLFGFWTLDTVIRAWAAVKHADSAPGFLALVFIGAVCLALAAANLQRFLRT